MAMQVVCCSWSAPMARIGVCDVTAESSAAEALMLPVGIISM